jgi:hypothetical protein
MDTGQAPELLHGVSAIAAHLGLNKRVIYHLASTTDMPTFRLGTVVCARRSSLDTWLIEREKEAMNARR